MQILPISNIKVPSLTKRRSGADRKRRDSEYDGAWSASPVDRRPSGFPANSEERYPAVANAFIHSQVEALLGSQFTEYRHRIDAPTDPYHADRLNITKGRALISPNVLNDRDLMRYVSALAPYALAPESESKIPPQSPAIVPYLLGGITSAALEKLISRVITLFKFPQREYDMTLSDAMGLVGFGPQEVYQHSDDISASLVNRGPNEDDKVHAKRLKLTAPKSGQSYAESKYLSRRQEWLLDKVPVNPFCNRLMRTGAYDESLKRKVTRAKWEVCAQTALIFQSEESELGKISRKWLTDGNPAAFTKAVQITDLMFEMAVTRVFERPWLELDLGGWPQTLNEDVEKVLARGLIKKLCGGGNRMLSTPPQLSPEVLVGLSLLTGIPIGKWLKFSLQDFCRRGETFISPKTIDQVYDLLYGCEDDDGVVISSMRCTQDLDDFKFQMQAWLGDERAPAIQRFAHRLRTGNNMLWSRNGRYHVVSYWKSNESEKEITKHKPALDWRVMDAPAESPFKWSV